MSGAVEIVNARGVPGTGVALGRRAARGRLLLSTHHILFGRGAAVGEPVYMLVPDGWARRRVAIGRTLWGRIGCVVHGGSLYFVDCAVASLDDDSPARARRAGDGAAPARVGALVEKSGAATGRTEGVIVSVAYDDLPFIDGKEYQARGQLLVRPADARENFSAPGDSGALLTDRGRRVLGLMWGCNGNGDGVASPIAPVLACLNGALGLSLDSALDVALDPEES